MIDAKKLKELVRLMVENDLTELDLESEGERVSLKRPRREPPVVAPPAAVGAPAPPPLEETPGLTITSPMVGSFYTSPSPDAEPFVAVGQRVDADTVVCLIEAMKVFNEIKAEATGTIARVLVQNGQPVEFGQPLFHVTPG